MALQVRGKPCIYVTCQGLPGMYVMSTPFLPPIRAYSSMDLGLLISSCGNAPVSKVSGDILKGGEFGVDLESPLQD